MKKRYVIFTAIIGIIAICGLLVPEQAGIWTLSDNISAADIAWMITATIFVLMMTPGLSFFYGGMVRKKNVISTILQSIIAMGIISVLWVFVGFMVWLKFLAKMSADGELLATPPPILCSITLAERPPTTFQPALD